MLWSDNLEVRDIVDPESDNAAIATEGPLARFAPTSSLPIFSCAISGLIAFLLAHIRTAIRAPVPPHAFEMINAGRCVQPNHYIGRTMLLRFRLDREKLNTAFKRQRDD